MLEDAARYDELELQQREDHMAFTETQQKICEEHSQLVNMR
jgi:hypothetical protein